MHAQGKLAKTNPKDLSEKDYRTVRDYISIKVQQLLPSQRN